MIAKAYLDKLTYGIIGAAIEVHKIMGRGLLESVTSMLNGRVSS